MEENVNELREKIAEKNLILNSLKADDTTNLEKKRLLWKELDRLLYLYFKSLKGTLSIIY